MKISKARLKTIILEELQNVMSEFNMADLDIVNTMRIDNQELADQLGTTTEEVIELSDPQNVVQDLDDLRVDYNIEDGVAVINYVPEEFMDGFRRLY